MECFIIWGNGTKYFDKIFNMIKGSFEVVTVARKDIYNMEDFVKRIYVQEIQTIPHHIMAKNRHLLECRPEAVLVLVNSNGNNKPPVCKGHGPNNQICTSFTEHFKHVVRDIYNPKQPCGKRTEDHVIHGSDDDTQVENALKAFGLKPLCEWAVADCLNWTADDFSHNHKINQNANQKEELRIRGENLEELSDVFEQFNIPFWLQGKTLLGLFRHNQFIIPDHDDDVGVFEKYRIKVCTHIYPFLKKKGFRAIRNDEWFLSIIRDDRYMDICFFKQNQDRVGYASKWFPKKYFDQFDSLRFHDRAYLVPAETTELLNLMYPGKAEPPKGIKATRSNRPLSYEDFLNCLIDADNSINWTLRGQHLNLITDNARNKKIGEIIDFFKDYSKATFIKSNSLIESDTSRPFEEPVNLNKEFWQTGNNYFFNCIYHGFRKDVVPYSKANKYITNINKPQLYSEAYYESLNLMTYSETRSFLEENPIVIENGAITHGQHRVCAMIGMLAAGNEYMPLYVE